MRAADKTPSGREGEFSPLVVTAGLMITAYLTANVMAVKLVDVGGVVLFDAGTVTFPLAYMLGDVLTEIWGFRVAKKVIWLTFFCNVVLVCATSVGVLLPSPDYLRKTSDAYAEVFAYVPRIVFASLVAFLCGELSNAYYMEKIKRRTDGKYLWMRTIGSSAIGYVFDTVLFVFIAFWGTVPAADLFSMAVGQYALKLAAESICGTPLAYAAVHALKKWKA
ncbi:MAG: queuosine precursor transporter [Synergistaceae bacterium]|nr:queuosine precursor transporter [Synergistaceae bacterium]